MRRFPWKPFYVFHIIIEICEAKALLWFCICVKENAEILKALSLILDTRAGAQVYFIWDVSQI